ncbi:MAG: hypothetical protein IR153_06310, partial [Flavobacterium sp.]|nr:hypothetical protein [Flavobacterium sp.]
MSKNLHFRHVMRVVVFALMLFGYQANAQLLLSDDFNYPIGSLLTANGWTALASGATTQPINTTTGLTFPGYVGSGIGGAAHLDANGQDVNRSFASQESGTVYASFILQTSPTNSQGYFFHFGTVASATTYLSRVWVNGTGTGLGIGQNAPSSYVDIQPNMPYLVVVKYEVSTKVSSLFVLNAMTVNEPLVAGQTFAETQTIPFVGTVGLRQYNDAQRQIVDGIRVGKTWADVVAFSSPTITTSTSSIAVPGATFGTPSLSSAFIVTGMAIEQGGITIEAPAGFEVSTSPVSGFAPQINIAGSNQTQVFVRLAATTNAGTHSGNITLSAAGANTVTVAIAPSTVLAKAVLISGLTAEDKVYDATRTATITGTPVSSEAGWDVTGIAEGTFDTKNVGSNKSVTVSGLNFSTSAESGLIASNYNFVYPTLTASISQAPLTVTGIVAADKNYDATTDAVLTGTAVLNVFGDDQVLLSGIPVATFASSEIGDAIPVTVTGYSISGPDAANYSFSQPTGLVANILDTGKDNQTIVFEAPAAVTYGDANFTLTANSTSNLEVSFTSDNEDVATVSGNVVTITGAGTAVITAYQSGNDDFNPASMVYQTLVVNTKELTVADALIADKVYDGTTVATISSVTLAGVVGADDVNASGVAEFATKNVGVNIPVTTNLVLSGADASNYTLVQSSDFSANILSRAVSVEGLTGIDKVYDNTTDAAVAGAPILIGVVIGDVLSIAGYNNVAFDNSNVGTDKTITIGEVMLSGVDAGNYTVSVAQTITADITARELTITGISADDKIFDNTTSATISGTPELVGVLDGDLGNVTVEGTPTGTFASSAVGTDIAVTVTGYTLGGSEAGNYELTLPTLSADITGLNAPVATAASSITSDGFVANWNAVPGATSYELDLSTSATFSTEGPGVTIVETFTGLPGASGSYLTRVWLGNGGITWNAYNVRTDVALNNGNDGATQSGSTTGAIALHNSGSAYIESGVITGGITAMSFEVQQAFGGSGGQISASILSGPNFATVTNLGNMPVTNTKTTYSRTVSVTGDYKIRINHNGNVRPTIDNLSFTSMPVDTPSFVAGYDGLNVGNVTSHEIGGLEEGTTYHYRVRAVNANNESANSNTIEVTTTLDEPTFTRISANDETVCANTNIVVEVVGLLPFTTSTITYNIGGGDSVAVENVQSNSTGFAIFSVNVTAEDNNQVLTVTSIERTDAGNAVLVVTENNTITLSVGVEQTYYADADGDGYGNAAVSITSCVPVEGYVLDGTDCDDL